MVARHYEERLALHDLRHRFSLSLKGANLSRLMTIARQLGFQCRPLRLDLEELNQLKTPCILHWDLNRFVVLAKAEPGDRVLLRYQAYPYQKFGHYGGKVIRVSRSAITPTTANGESADPYYRVLVALDQQSITAYGKQETLRPGMRLDADILDERRKLYEWVLEPLYSLRGQIGQ